jgi:hypothetical protein
MDRGTAPARKKPSSPAPPPGLFGGAGLPEPDATFYELRGDVPSLLARSFPNPGDDLKIIEMFKASAADDRLGVPVRLDAGEIYYAYPVAILAATRPG